MPTILVNRSVRQSDFKVGLVAQVTQDIIPTSPVFDLVHLRTGGKPTEAVTYEQSNAISSTGQPKVNIRTGSDLALELEAEFSDQHKTLIAAALESSITDNSVTAATISSDANGFLGTGAEFAALAVGDFYFATGFTNPLLNRAYLLTVKNTSADIETSPAPAAIEAAGATVTFSSHKMALGLTPTLYVAQTSVIDESRVGLVAYETFYNGFLNTYGLSVPEQGIVTATAAMVFENKLAGYSAVAGQTFAALATSEPSTTPLVRVWLDGVESTECFLKTVDLNIEHGYEGNAAAQCAQKRQAKGNPTVGGSLSTLMLTGNTYFWKEKVNNGTPINLAFSIDLRDGKQIMIVMPKAKLTSHSDDGDTSVNNAIDYSCEPDVTTGIALFAFTNY
jgi:hypothetical protein